jgi:hypothetical protein
MLPLIVIGAAVAGLVAIIVAIIKFAKIKAWLRARQNLTQEDKDVIAFTIKKNLEDGNYEVVKGFFNTSTDELLDGEKEQSRKIDDELEQVHNGKELVLYE